MGVYTLVGHVRSSENSREECVFGAFDSYKSAQDWLRKHGFIEDKKYANWHISEFENDPRHFPRFELDGTVVTNASVYIRSVGEIRSYDKPERACEHKR